MTKWINVPSDCWLKVKLTLKKFVTDHHIIHHAIMMGAGFVMHRPSSINKIETFFLNQVSDLILVLIILMVPPHSKILHLYLCETFIWIRNEFIHVGGDYIVD